MRSEAEANRALELYSDMVRRISFLYLKNHADVDDVFQNVFLKYILHKKDFESDAHEKAWLIRVTINTCKDELRRFFRKNIVSFEDRFIEPFYFDNTDKTVINSVMALPQKYRDIIYLFYYEGYSAVEIASILKKNENTVYSWLSRARAQLKESLGGEQLEE